MAETRSKTLKDLEEAFGGRITALEGLVADQGRKMKEMVSEHNEKMEKNFAGMFKMMKLKNTINTLSSGSKQGIESSEVCATPVSQVEHSDHGREVRSDLHSTYGVMTRLGKIDFPRFAGDLVEDWLFKGEEFFSIDFTPNHLKTKIASIHFDGAAAK